MGSQVSARRLALIALEQWQAEIGRSDAIISQLLANAPISGADRAFTFELFYGVLRNLTLLDFWIGCLRPAHVDAEVRDILRLGLYQLLFLGTADYAAVDESVTLARPRARGVINGILRTAVRQREELQRRSVDQPLSVRESHPEFLVSRWQKHFGAEATVALCRWNNQPAPIYGRINELTIDSEQFLHRYPQGEACEQWSGFVRFPSPPIEALARGHCYVQDPSTTLACRILDPQPGETILDACAAPGGKTTYLAQLMQNRGAIVACDRDPKRVDVLRDNVRRMQASMVQVVQHDWREERLPVALQAAAPFDRILLDAPCTNTGVMRRRIDVRWRLTPDEFSRMQLRQLEIARSVVGLLKPGGILVYSTCSLESEENEVVANRLTSEVPAANAGKAAASLPFRDSCDGAFAVKISVGSNRDR
ncbi:MAG: transcription antitermination factor NusB [Chthoniobacterales bacterium]